MSGEGDKHESSNHDNRPDAMDLVAMGQRGQGMIDRVVYGFGVAQDWYVDTYDLSVEILGVPADWVPNVEQLVAFSKLGFVKAYVSRVDGSCEVINVDTGSRGSASHREPREDGRLQRAALNLLERHRLLSCCKPELFDELRAAVGDAS